MLARMANPPEELQGLTIKQIARVARVDPTTARRWRRGVVPVPAGILLLLSGDLGCFDPAWSGWILRRGQLISPEGWEATPGQVLATRLHEAQLAAWRTENRHLRELVEYLQNGGLIRDDQPPPEEFANSQEILARLSLRR